MEKRNVRKHWIDNLRWVTVLLVLLYHVIYFYNNKGVFGGIGGFGPYPEYPQKHSFMPRAEHFCVLIISVLRNFKAKAQAIICGNFVEIQAIFG